MWDVIRPIKLACLDLAGTTIGDIAMVERAFAEAIATQGIVPGTGHMRVPWCTCIGPGAVPKIEVFRGIFPATRRRPRRPT